jgi:WhiB family redox-sensing transcriptional regulator
MDALCAQVDPELFFPEQGEPSRPARRVCAACPVRRPCLEWAVATGQRYGVWGGLSDRERKRWRRDARLAS